MTFEEKNHSLRKQNGLPK